MKMGQLRITYSSVCVGCHKKGNIGSCLSVWQRRQMFNGVV